MASSLLNDDESNAGLGQDPFVKIIIWLITFSIAIALGLIAAWET